MREQNPGSLRGIVEGLGLPDRFQTPLAAYIEDLDDQLDPVCIVLFGSLAKGTYTHYSDIDLVVVLDNLPAEFHDRWRLLSRLNKSICPIDAFSYTPTEFEQMLVRGHVTALDSMADGICLHGPDYFAKMQEVYQDMVRRGLCRGIAAWTMPAPAVNTPGDSNGP